jgi:small-conductance mechanosensitive channel
MSDLLHRTLVCRELEEEVERVRAFYTKKVEEVQRKGEAQLRALKRGTEAATAAPGTAEAPVRNLFGAQDAEGATQQALTQAQMQVVQLQQQLQQTTGAYSEHLALLERELMSTAEELGRVKAAAGMGSNSVPAVDRASYIPRPGQTGVPLTPPSGVRPHEGGRPAAMAESERQQLVAMHQARLDELKAHHADFVSQLKAQWSAEREGLQQRVKEEEARCLELRKELFDAVRAMAHAPVPTAATAVPSAAPQPRRGPDVRQFEVSSCLNAPLFSVTS